MLFPRKCHQHAHPRLSASVEKPRRGWVINPHDIQAGLSHQGEIHIHLLGAAEMVPFGVRLEGTVRDAFDKKLFVPFYKKFRRWTNSRDVSRCHIERRRLPSRSSMRTLKTSLDV